MSTISSISTQRTPAKGGSVQAALALIKRGWLAYMSWRMERLAVARLQAMSDRQLTDIGIVRSEIECAVRHGTSRDRIVSLAGLCFCVLCLSV
jgi:uncharacterized protein YjiS (DUF1127 family)